MDDYDRLLWDNKAWAAERVKEDPEFFLRLTHLQTPKFMWIGCSDSRVPANEITGTRPGEIFVHRNVANLMLHSDLNALSVLQYAVEVLKVNHVIVCGHYGCGGVKAAMKRDSLGLIDKWLRNIKDVYRLHRDELDAIEDEDARADRLVELNVREQVTNLAKTTIVQTAWKQEQRPSLHGWVYDLSDGIIDPLFEVAPGTDFDPLYRYDNL